MAYTFGGSTTDDINWTSATALTASGSRLFVGGWFYPTTLTAGRAYWGDSNTSRLRVGSTTSEIEWVCDRTTDTVITTSGAGITTDKWWFIAAAVSGFNTGPVDEAYIWVGDADNPPRSISTSLSAGSGNTPGNASFGIGNGGGSGSVSFQGDIDMIYAIQEATNNADSLFASISSGQFLTPQDFILPRYVMPLWLGQNIPVRITVRAVTATLFDLRFEGESTPQVYELGVGNSSSTPLRTTNVNGATNNRDVRCPRPRLHQPYQPSYVRRR